MPMGTLTKKIQRQLTFETMRPPRMGPRTGPMTMGTPMMLMTRPMRCGPAARAKMDWPTGSSMPPPMPWSTRKSDERVGRPGQAAQARAEDEEEDARSATCRLAPKRSTAQPVTGVTMASASR